MWKTDLGPWARGHPERSEGSNGIDGDEILRCAQDDIEGVALPSLSTRGGVQGVAGGADSADEVGVLFAVQRDAQAADMHVDGARLDIDVLAPHCIEELLAREDAAGL